MHILYGTKDKSIDITNRQIKVGNTIIIPCNDVFRADIYGDPIVGVKKTINIAFGEDNAIECDDTKMVFIDTVSNKINIVSDKHIVKKLATLHQSLQIHHGTFDDEYNEQKMAARFIKPGAKVLEIGSNIGRNTLIIASLLENKGVTMVTMECDPESYAKLVENRELNGLVFHAENSALSARPLIQRGWDTYVSDVVPEGFTKVNTIGWSDLLIKYCIDFDTLVLDCEGAFYYILLDMPEILTNIQTIIMENDYRNRAHKDAVDQILKNNGFIVVYREIGGWEPCYHCFYETWIRNS